MSSRFQKRNGNILIALLLVMFLTFLGLSLLGFGMFHTWIRNARMQKITETNCLHQELIYYLHFFREKIFNQDLRAFPNPETGYFNKSNFPDTTIGSGTGQGIVIKNSFTHLDFPKEFYTKTRIIDRLSILSPKTAYNLKAEVSIGMVSGQIPLPFFPFFLENSSQIAENTNVLVQDILNNSEESTSTPDMSSSDIDVEINSAEFLLNCLEVQGTALTWAAMREKFGFEISNEPIPEGIHLLVEDNLVKCIFIQGNIERLVFSIVNDTQVIRIIKQGITSEYRYKPGKNYFYDVNNLKEEPWLCLERIVVNGNTWSLQQEGDAAFTAGTDITFFSSGTVNIHSNLSTKTKNLDMQKILSTSLILICSSGTLFDREDLKPGVMIERPDGSTETSIQVSIITNGKLTNKSPHLKVNGSIYTKDLENHGIIEIDHILPGSDWGLFFKTMDFKYIYYFHIESIEEMEETP
ncbi:MAG: hypothetical protein MUF15_10390 [Acidobacteria bacterium]|jgi:hypothetical protein|nr:hypothetical protein [Acidobacteriota bacterium]